MILKLNSLEKITSEPSEKNLSDFLITLLPILIPAFSNVFIATLLELINSIREGEVIGEHEVKFSSGKEIITLNHESFDRALYSEGALTAAAWLMSKKAGLYSMRDLLNFK